MPVPRKVWLPIVSVTPALFARRRTMACASRGVMARRLEKAREMANHADTRTTRLYARRAEDVSLDDVERISI